MIFKRFYGRPKGADKLNGTNLEPLMSDSDQPQGGVPPRIELDPHQEPERPAYNPYQAPGAARLEPPSEFAGGESRPVPWEDEEADPSWWSRLKATLLMSFKAPLDLADRIPATEGFWKPYLYLLACSVPVIILSVLGQLVSLAIQGAVLGMTGAARPNPLQGMGLGAGAMAGFMIVFLLVLMPLFMFLGIFIGGAINHFFLWMFGGTKEGVGLGQTIRLYAYAQGAYQIVAAASAIPIVGCIFLLVLIPFVFVWLTYYGLALARMHRTDSWRGVCAIYAPMVLTVCCVAFAAVAMFSAIAKYAH